MACKIIWEERGILFKHSGTTTNEEASAANNQMYGDPRFSMIEYQISDYSGVTNNLVSMQGAKEIGTLDRTSSRWTKKNMKVAVVTQDMKFINVVETYFQKIMEAGWEGRIFNSLEKAYQWVLEKQTVG